MISIVTAVHNGLAFNKIYLEYLRRYTAGPYEIIIVDNASTDGTREFFRSEGCVVIENDENYSYPYCQNQGIRAATGDYLFFLNNDVIVSPEWDLRLMEGARLHGLDVISGTGIENLGSPGPTQAIDRRWKRIKNPLSVLGFADGNLRRMHRWMYGNWERYCEARFREYGYTVVEGILGNNVLMTRRAVDLMGGWDERIQAADFDLFMRVKARALEHGDIRPCHIALGVFIHHYIRLTVKYAVRPKPFADKDRLIGIHDKWNPEQLERLHPDNATKRK